MFFSDHGAPGLIAFPGKYMHADELLTGFKQMAGKYSKLTFYLESCESGSMFVNLPTDSKIYALSAANPTESSYGTYCAPDDVIEGKHLGSCLGDLFSVKFLEDSDTDDLSKETLQSQFEKIKAETSLSHVLQWGDVSFVNETVDQFIGNKSAKLGSTAGLIRTIKNRYLSKSTRSTYNTFDSRYNKIRVLSDVYMREGSAEALREMQEEMQSMLTYDLSFGRFAEQFRLDGRYAADSINHDCMRALISHYEGLCGKLSDYALKHLKYFAQGCESHFAEEMIKELSC